MQNNIIKEFVDNENVVTALVNHAEDLGWVNAYWRNLYLRDLLLHDPSSDGVAVGSMAQPNTGMPYGRYFIIDQDGRVALPYLLHQPELAISKIYELLGDAGIPVANDDTASTDQDVPSVISVLDNDSDPNGDPLRIEAVTQGQNGSVSFDLTTVTYTPDLGFVGGDTFTYTITDDVHGSDSATVTMTVLGTGGNVPVANEDAATTDQDMPIVVFVLDNDVELDGDAMRVSAVTQGTNGTAVFDDITVTYTPDPGFVGDDTVTYTVTDDVDGSDTATVTITVQGLGNQPPIPVDDFYTTDVDTVVQLWPLQNDSDPEGDTLSLDDVSDPANGSTVFRNDQVRYSPSSGFSGTDVFTYTVNDGAGNTAIGTITVTVGDIPSNEAPSVNAGADQSADIADTVALDGTVTDDGLPDPPALLTTTWSQLSGPGVASFADASSVDTTVTFSATGSYDLELAADDGELQNADTVTVTVTDTPPVNTAPVVDAGSDHTADISDIVVLDATVTDDGLPTPPGVTSIAWSQLSGPGTANFADASIIDTTVTFTAEGTYVLMLSAFDGELTDDDTLSITVTAGDPTTPPSPPSGLQVTVNGSGHVELLWTDNSDNETTFEIERASSTNRQFGALATVDADVVSYSDTTVSAGLLYRYRVRAVNTAGASAWITSSTVGL